jgi:VIT1/CCC1 family predicted Fe2+/Mn2+ transporter
VVSVVVESEEARLQAKLRKLAAVQAKVESDVAAAKGALTALQNLVAAREAELVALATAGAASGGDEVEWRAKDVALAVLQQIKTEVGR